MVGVAPAGDAEMKLEVERSQAALVLQQLPPVDAPDLDVVPQDERGEISEAGQAAAESVKAAQAGRDGGGFAAPQGRAHFRPSG
ncbi:MAG TPA: hypothetical protein VHM31_22820 [Polyangia bacterium]|nr:hypothetical protein [Polyangia bacterium]HVY40798.1 hypothetical protein [Polyangia bacterium]